MGTNIKETFDAMPEPERTRAYFTLVVAAIGECDNAEDMTRILTRFTDNFDVSLVPDWKETLVRVARGMVALRSG